MAVSLKSSPNARVSAQDIADRLGVARPTVSTVLSGASSNTRVSQALRDRVRNVALEMGYRPNAAAKAIARGKFGGAGLITSVERMRSNLPPDLLWGITHALESMGMHLVLAALPDEQLTDGGNLPRMLSEWMIDGLLINYNKQIPPAMGAVIQRHAIPSVWLNVKQDWDSVYPDDQQASRLATRLLLDAGHRRIAYTGNLHPTGVGLLHYSEVDRHAGYEQAMNEAGLTPDVIERDRFGRQPSAGREYWLERLAGADHPTAVVAYGRPTLDAVVLAAERLGMDIPGQLSLVTFGDWPQSLGRRIDTILIPQEAMGRAAVDMLFEKVRRPQAAIASVSLPASHFAGQTIEPPRL